MTHDDLVLKYNFLKNLALVALVGVACLAIVLAVFDGEPHPGFGLLILLVLPVMLYLVLIVVWHWKSRYIGERSNLWGALIVIETSGWLKLIYLFRHIAADVNRTGRYKQSPDDYDDLEILSEDKGQ